MSIIKSIAIALLHNLIGKPLGKHPAKASPGVRAVNQTAAQAPNDAVEARRCR